MTRVAYVTQTAMLSGAELALARQVVALQQTDPVVLVGEDGPLVDLLRGQGITVHVIPLSPRTLQLRRDGLSLRRMPLRAISDSLRWTLSLRKVLCRLRPDIVETGSMKAHLCGGLAAKALGIPHIWRAHDRVARPYLRRSSVLLVRIALRFLPGLALANSKSTAETLRLPAKMVAVIPTPIPSAEFRERSTGHSLRVVHVGRLAPWKGQEVFLHAFARAFAEGTASACIVGAALFGEHDYARSLKRMAQDLGLGDRVTFFGFREDVYATLLEADVLVHSSTIPEPFGQVVVEGMSAGLAVIAANAGGPAEVVDHDRTGILVEPNDIEALAEALDRLSREPQLRARLGAAARVASQKYSPEVVVPRIEEQYARLLAAVR